MAVDRRQPSPAGRQPTFVDRPHDLPEALRQRVVIERVRPQVDAGRFPIKRTVGERVRVTASIYTDGHEVIAARLRDRFRGITPAPPGPSIAWREAPMEEPRAFTDDWIGSFEVSHVGWHEYTVVAWIDRFRSWRRDLEIRAAAGQDVSLELVEGSFLVREAAARAEQSGSSETARLLTCADVMADEAAGPRRFTTAIDETLAGLMDRFADRSRATESAPLLVRVDRERARFGAWYEMFPRSSGPDADRSGTFRDAAAHLPYIAGLGFDVVYLPPIHPIGRSYRKGRGNSLVAGPTDPGSPWAIGSEAGGHTSVDPGLGTLEDFDRFREEAERQGLEVALDLAFQCSPDHPWVSSHPDWFRHRPDGTIKYAENPPKKYQDIYPLDFECDDWRALWHELLEVTLFWADRRVRIFRVDNPHTKPFNFWSFLIARVQSRYPDVVFLAEAFTRPALMRHIAKIGFTQSYSYFTWRNSKPELTEHLSELMIGEVGEYLRPNLFANTPDILHAYLQTGGRPAFEARLLLAATLGASYGIYSGFELCERRAISGTEEYAESEKYQFRKWDLDRPGNIKELVARVNAIRHHHPALQFDRHLRFHESDNPQIIVYSKTAPDDSEVLLVVVSLDPHGLQHGRVRCPIDGLGIPPDQAFAAHDLLDDAVYHWRGEWNYVRFDPGVKQGHILKLEVRSKK